MCQLNDRLGTALDGHDLCISFCFLFVFFFVGEESYKNQMETPPPQASSSGGLNRFDAGWVKSDELHPFWELSHIPFKGTCEDDVPFPKVGYVCSVDGKSKESVEALHLINGRIMAAF